MTDITRAYDWEEKIWGRTCRQPVSALKDSEERAGIKYSLVIQEGGCCSFHYHANRSNRFEVTSGVLRVVWAIGWELFHRDLRKGDSLLIRANIPHQFQCLRGESYAKEIYLPDGGGVDVTDIVRMTTGVKLDSKSERFRTLVERPCVVLADGSFRTPIKDD